MKTKSEITIFFNLIFKYLKFWRQRRRAKALILVSIELGYLEGMETVAGDDFLHGGILHYFHLRFATRGFLLSAYIKEI
jgi:hypothetical protein